MIKIDLFNFKSRGTEKVELSSQEIDNFQILVKESLIIANYAYAKIFRFVVLDIKLRPKDDNSLHQF